MLREQSGFRSSSNIRDALVAQHEGLRRLLNDTIELVEEQALSGVDLETLRVRARELYLIADAQLTFEEGALPVALRDVIGWGDVLQSEIEADHRRRRVEIGIALTALEPDSLSWVELADDVRTFAGALLLDLNRDDASLLVADVDAVMTDSNGG